MEKLIKYFSDKHILTNFLVIAVFIGAVIFWNKTGKEEMPNITFDSVSVSASYPGATAEEVEYFVTKEIEDALEGIDGIDEVNSSSSQGSCSIRISLTPNNPDRDTVVSDIKEAVATVKLPDEIEKTPNVREFKSSRFGILDIMMYYNEVNIMTTEQRIKLQSLANTLQDQLTRLPSVSEVDINGDMTEYIEIIIDPAKLVKYNISLSEIISSIKANNIKQPLGTLDDDAMTKIRLDAELNRVDEIKEIIIRSDFEGNALRLSSIADIKETFQRQREITKINGSESLELDVTKKSGAGILKAVDEVKDAVNKFSENVLKDSNVKITFMNDGSEGVRSRLSLIASNGLLGFVLIAVLLLVLLNFKSAFWVAMGIPFSFGFTMIAASLMGNTINNMTLAAVIIVMGMLVDDAIVVAENISRLRDEGIPMDEAVVKGTSAVFVPILGSITTTCVAFITLFFFQGRFALMIRVIPPIIFLMLGGSLFEALFILPSHLKHKFPRWVRVVFSLGTLPFIEKYYEKKKNGKKEVFGDSDRHWFLKVEDAFGKLLMHILKFKWLVYIIFVSILIFSSWTFITKMKYSLFPREETTVVFLSGAAPEGTLKYETEKMVRQVEEIFSKRLGKDVVAFRTNIARSRRGRSALENVFSIFIELVPKEKRKKSSKQIIAEWEEEIKKIEGFDELGFGRGWFGQSSGSPIEIQIQENDDETKYKVAEEIKNYFKRMPSLVNPEIETVLYTPQYSIKLRRELMNRLNVSISTLAATLRTVLEGNNIFDLIERGETIDVIVSVPEKDKNNIDAILNIPIPNNSGYLVPLHQLVDINKTSSPDSISRINSKRVLHVYADLNDKTKEADIKLNNNGQQRNNGGDKKRKNGIDEEEKIEKLDLPEKMTPLEIADHLEANLFPELLKNNPTTNLIFVGEIADSRESNQDFIFSVIFVIVLIYIILALILNSIFKPMIIILSVPFGFAGIILALQVHGMFIYGFFSIIGALGLAGVVVNDSIILLDKLEIEYPKQIKDGEPFRVIANITKTRLRAVLLTTITTVAGLLPTAYGVFGYDSMLAEMMLTMAWGLIFGTLITLVLVPTLYCTMKESKEFIKKIFKHSPKAVIILLFLFSSTFFVSSDEITKPISLQDFISGSTKNSHFSQILLKEINAVYQEKIKKLPGDFTLSIQSEYQLNYNWIKSEEAAGSSSSTSTSSEPEWKAYNNFKGSVSLSKLFSYTGTTLSGTYSISPKTTYETAASTVNIKIEQDIAKNAFGFATRVQNKIAGNEKQVAYYQAVEAYEDYLSSLITMYMDWYVAYKALEASRKSYQESLSLFENTKKMRAFNIALPVDVNKSELQNLSKKENLLQAETNYKKALFLMKNLMGLDGNEKIFPDFNYVFNIDIEDVEKAFEEYKTDSRAAQVLNFAVKESELTNIEVINDLLPTAKLFASYSISGNGYFFDESDEDTKPSHAVNIGGSLNFKIPQWGTFAKYKAQRLDNEDKIFDKKNSLNDTWSDLNKLYLNIKNEELQLGLAKQKVELSEKISKDELIDYRQGRSSLNDLIQVYNTLDTNRLSEINHLIQLGKYYIEWLRLTDKLVTNEKKVNL